MAWWYRTVSSLLIRWFGDAVIAVRRKARGLLHGAIRPDDLEIRIPGVRTKAENHTIVVTRRKLPPPAIQRVSVLPLFRIVSRAPIASRLLRVP